MELLVPVKKERPQLLTFERQERDSFHGSCDPCMLSCLSLSMLILFNTYISNTSPETLRIKSG